MFSLILHVFYASVQNVVAVGAGFCDGLK